MIEELKTELTTLETSLLPTREESLLKPMEELLADARARSCSSKYRWRLAVQLSQAEEKIIELQPRLDELERVLAEMGVSADELAPQAEDVNTNASA